MLSNAVCSCRSLASTNHSLSECFATASDEIRKKDGIIEAQLRSERKLSDRMRSLQRHCMLKHRGLQQVDAVRIALEEERQQVAQVSPP